MFGGFDNIFHVYLLDERIPKIWKKLNSHGGFLGQTKAVQKFAAKWAVLA